MKKSILAVAGLAAVAGIAAPVAGAFAATDPITDNLTLTISDNCSFTRTNGSGSYTQTMAVNALNAAFGASTFTVICNNAKGYNVSAVFSVLKGNQDTPETIAYSDTTPIAGSGTWTAYKTNGEANIAATSGVLMTKSSTTTASGDTETVTYKVSTTDHQAQGQYTGTAVYTFAQNK